MGYKVKCYPKDKPAGMLARGQVVAPHFMGTYFSSPSAALKSAEGWVSRNPGAYAEVLTFRDGALVETLY